jgi:serine/threonine-protein kinase
MQSGQTIAGKYRLNRILGSGGMASVWSGTNVFTEREFAIKFMLPQVARTPEAARRFLLEAKVSGRINHPNIIEVIDVGQAEDGSLFLVMELLSGMSLEAAVRRRTPPMRMRDFFRIMRDVASALAAAHKSGVIHRDLKPTNVFLHTDRDGRVLPKVLDFGVSKVLEEGNDALTVVGTILGSPLYMSPEQAMGAEGIDGRTDIFAFGSILFEALCGHRAYTGGNLNALIVAIATTAPKSIDDSAPHLSEAIRSLVRDCMVTDKAERLASFDQIVERLDRIIEEASSEERLPVPIRKGDPTPEPPPVADVANLLAADRSTPSADPGGVRLPPPANPTALAISTPVPLVPIGRTPGAAAWRRLDRLTHGHARTVAWALGGAGLAACLLVLRTSTRGASAAPQAAVLASAAPAAAPPPQPSPLPSANPPSADSTDMPVVSVDSLPVAAHGGARAKSNGRLTVAATPGACAVTIDGVARGDTPLPSLELSVGIHRVECAPPTGAAQAVKVVISEGTESHYQFALAQ